jgi:hypothetical protein
VIWSGDKLVESSSNSKRTALDEEEEEGENEGVDAESGEEYFESSSESDSLSPDADHEDKRSEEEPFDLVNEEGFKVRRVVQLHCTQWPGKYCGFFFPSLTSNRQWSSKVNKSHEGPC